jgi:hypothetical protein
MAGRRLAERLTLDQQPPVKIVLQANALERGILGEQYELVQRDLEEQGHEVTFRRPSPSERSAVPPLPGIDFTVAAFVYVVGRVTEQLLDEITRPLRERLVASFRVTRPRKALILGANEEVLRVVDLPPEPLGGRGSPTSPDA